MANKRTITIDDELYSNISAYCALNKLKISQYCNKLLKDAFAMDKYGDIPFGTFDERNENEINTEENATSGSVVENIVEIPEIKIIDSLVRENKNENIDNQKLKNQKRRL